VYDAVVDFDKALRDPYDPRRLRPDYDSGDHLHPSDEGYAQMAEVFDLHSLKGAAPAQL
jgi:lysophospholipase L1-like esterase